jgi:hypothetical protein
MTLLPQNLQISCPSAKSLCSRWQWEVLSRSKLSRMEWDFGSSWCPMTLWLPMHFMYFAQCKELLGASPSPLGFSFSRLLLWLEALQGIKSQHASSWSTRLVLWHAPYSLHAQENVLSAAKSFSNSLASALLRGKSVEWLAYLLSSPRLLHSVKNWTNLLEGNKQAIRGRR